MLKGAIGRASVLVLVPAIEIVCDESGVALVVNVIVQVALAAMLPQPLDEKSVTPEGSAVGATVVAVADPILVIVMVLYPVPIVPVGLASLKLNNASLTLTESVIVAGGGVLPLTVTSIRFLAAGIELLAPLFAETRGESVNLFPTRPALSAIDNTRVKAQEAFLASVMPEHVSDSM